MKALVFGCGEMGETAVRDLVEYGPFDEIVVATRSVDKARQLLGAIGDERPKVRAVFVDVDTEDRLAGLVSGFDVVVNCIGPNYRYEARIARAAIEAGVDLVDINDDYEATDEMYALHDAARAAGVTVVLGLGASPGVNNVLVRAAADQLDSVEEIHTAWVMSGADPGGPALSYHLVRSLSGRASTFRDGRFQEVESFVDGRETIEFPPPVGAVDVFHVGHPEPLTLARAFPSARYIDDKASFRPSFVNELIRTLGRLVREAPEGLSVGGRRVDTMDFAAAYLHRSCKSLVDVPKEGALRVLVKGSRAGKRKTVVFASAGRLAQGTGVPASIGAIMLAQDLVEGCGVLAPEACIPANDFLYEIFNRRSLAELTGWSEEEPAPAIAS